MKNFKLHKLYIALLATGIGMFSFNTMAVPFIQCPGDNLLSDGVTPGSDGIPEEFLADGVIENPDYDPNVKCLHLSSGDGFATMADGRELYIFSFGDITGSDEADSIVDGTLYANMPAPTIVLEEGQEFYLTLSNVGMILRPDLFDPHTVHFHGFPNASAVFDGVPDNSISVNVGSSLSYYYNIVHPGTYIYHCHVEAAEHMQMGMMGNIYVHAAQDNFPAQTFPGGFSHTPWDEGDPLVEGDETGNRYVYNDGDGSTAYDVEFPIQLIGLDPDFHQASQDVQPLPFANMHDTYPLINGRGYPDTVNPNPLTPPAQTMDPRPVQGVSSLIEAVQGQKVLLRLSSVSTTEFFSIKTLGLDMKVVGMGANQVKPDNTYTTNTVTLGGGTVMDVIIDTTNVAPGTYYLYSSNLNKLSNDTQDYGGLMTEIVITAAGA